MKIHLQYKIVELYKDWRTEEKGCTEFDTSGSTNIGTAGSTNTDIAGSTGTVGGTSQCSHFIYCTYHTAIILCGSRDGSSYLEAGSRIIRRVEAAVSSISATFYEHMRRFGKQNYLEYTPMPSMMGLIRAAMAVVLPTATIAGTSEALILSSSTPSPSIDAPDTTVDPPPHKNLSLSIYMAVVVFIAF
ncbi:hypothetical protein M9H77_19049 [Catharanthus roseus]|uniref:Uncharacterized protein n=1 Tax=Catharanthus roseus TaxID=4058 RepID=A0ACC0B985_CATRO|nr:hypothetical protein M9H77_19049 [Catharanthus roseus]